MASKRKRKSWSKSDIKKHTANVRELLRKAEKSNRHDHFIGISDEAIAEKFKRVNSPFIYLVGWSYSHPGGSSSLTVGTYNPDPQQVTSLALHLWVGNGHADPSTGTFLANVDPRFARLSAGSPWGFSMDVVGAVNHAFTLPIPASIELSNYMVNVALVRFDPFGAGTLLDRAGMLIEVN